MKKLIINEKMFLNKSNIKKFTQGSSVEIQITQTFRKIKSKNKNIYAIGAPSRATT